MREYREWRWFLTRIRPAEFSDPNTFYPSGLRRVTPHELKSCLPCVHTRENPPYKGGCPKIGLDRRRGMNQNIPNPGLALKWPHPCSLPIEWDSRCSPPNVNLRPRVVLDTQVWLPARDGDGRSHSRVETFRLIPEGSAEQRLWKRLENETDLGVSRLKLERSSRAHATLIPTPREFSTFECGYRESLTQEVVSFNFNSLHNKIWLTISMLTYIFFICLLLNCKRATNKSIFPPTLLVYKLKYISISGLLFNAAFDFIIDWLSIHLLYLYSIF